MVSSVYRPINDPAEHPKWSAKDLISKYGERALSFYGKQRIQHRALELFTVHTKIKTLGG